MVFALSLVLGCVLSAIGQGAVGGAGEKSGLRPGGPFGSAQGRQPRAAIPTRKVALPDVDAAIEQAIDEKQVPGAVLIVGHDGAVIYRKAYGERALEPRARGR